MIIDKCGPRPGRSPPMRRCVKNTKTTGGRVNSKAMSRRRFSKNCGKAMSPGFGCGKRIRKPGRRGFGRRPRVRRSPLKRMVFASLIINCDCRSRKRFESKWPVRGFSGSRFRVIGNSMANCVCARSFRKKGPGLRLSWWITPSLRLKPLGAFGQLILECTIWRPVWRIIARGCSIRARRYWRFSIISTSKSPRSNIG